MKYRYVAPQVHFLLPEDKADEWNYLIKRGLAALGYNSMSAFLEHIFLVLMDAARNEDPSEIINALEFDFQSIIEGARRRLRVNHKKVWVIDKRWGR